MTEQQCKNLFIPATDETVHWGYFSKSLKPLVELDSGGYVTIAWTRRRPHPHEGYRSVPTSESPSVAGEGLVLDE